MALYTKAGDEGKTSLFGGERVSKSHLRVDTYGLVDELSSFIGLVAVKITNHQHRDMLFHIQKDLYIIMSSLAGSVEDEEPLIQQVKIFEASIDHLQSELPPLHQFIIPGGNEISAWLHILRVITRKTERSIVAFFEDENEGKTRSQEEMKNQVAITTYINRLSDYFFMLARWYGREQERIA
ncbi:MAG: cob(I)yrinic acid a,c-diamide adenosyltransferase [Candidatus Nanoarchaeia archaeon]